ncbi:class I adenylate-forming enzyme family protein [Oceanibacterium hippocampi]|uniref:3-methylmercaptopropionyl-CoA ligase n=1 Tax=Oceanibacterium hippocampi TaxID=745714 RepID=A0A1Y5TAJ7_9PROT|nr:class I adenylate-forming enzyme family protein [Oceanibacterium hippocampi]SLN59547.1 Long-chain-fatty-acid--CoA ligase [Oceanibacterium hippocampi]
MPAAMTNAEATRRLTAPGCPFEMEEATIRGVSLRVWKNARPDLRTILVESRAFGDRPYLVFEDEPPISYGEQYRRAARLAERLVSRFAVAKGDRVAIAMRNWPEWITAFWAAAATGAIVVPLNAWWTGEELHYGLENAEVSVLIADGERLASLQPYLDDLPALRGLVATRHDGTLPPKAVDWQALLDTAPADAELPDVAIAPDDPATIFYTSGTTGRPKGALGTHRNICTNPVSVAFTRARAALRRGLSAEDAVRPSPPGASIVPVPLFHVTGCHSALVTNTLAGNKMVLMHRWNAERALALVDREGVTAISGVPAMIWQLIESPDFSRYDLSKVVSVGYGGAPAAPELLQQCRKYFPQALVRNGYGMTETSSVAAMNWADDFVAHPDSVGAPVAVCDYRIVGADGQDLGPGEIGELWMKGPNVIAGYWRNPEATAQAITEGWIHSGDLARKDEDDFVYIVDRAKDMVIRGGENVYCVEVEDALYSHPGVMDAAVVGIPHRVLGEEVAAMVQVKRESRVSEAELQAWVRERLAGFKVPVSIVFDHEPLPRNANGKILKAEVRAIVQAAATVAG